jgi:hypothetical protein
MAKDCLMHLVQRYHPEQAILLRTQTANQIATHLLQLDSKRDKRTLHRQQLFRIIRTPEEDLSAALAKAQLCINAIYPANDPAYTAHRSNTLRAAILSFCSDPVAQVVMELIRSKQMECQPLTDDEILDYAIKYEEFSHMRPTTNLQFGRDVNNMPVASFIQLNSMNTVTNTTYPAYPAYPNQCADPYPALSLYGPINHNFQQNNNHPPLHHQQQMLVPPFPMPQTLFVPPIPEPDFHQAGLNSMQPTTGYVKSTGLRVPSNDKQRTRKSSYHSHSPSPDREKSPGLSSENRPSRAPYRSTYHSQSPSRDRDKTSGFSSENRPSRAPYRSNYRSKDRSSSTRRLYPQMLRGLNCRSNYDPCRMKHCTKCMKNNHHEFECSRYYKYSDQKCTICHRMYHSNQECREVKEFPPRITSKN